MSKYCPICYNRMTRRGIFGKRRCTNLICAITPTPEEYDATYNAHVLSVIESIDCDIAYYMNIHENNPYIERLSRYEHAKGNVAFAKKMHFIPDEYELPKFEL